MLGGPLALDAEKHHPHQTPVLVLPKWELAPSSQMVEVIQKAPRPGNANNTTINPVATNPVTLVSAAAHAPVLPLTTTAAVVHPERDEVEITLTPVMDIPSSSSISVVVKNDEETEKREGR